MQDTKKLFNLREIISSADFSAVGVADFEVMDDEREHLRRWIAAGMHAEMGYMERSINIRHDARNVFPEVKSVIVTLTAIKRVCPHSPTIAAFAHNFTDYHYDIKKKLNDLLKRLQEADPEIRGRAVVDSAPVFEKAWGVRAGLGWIGRNSLLINPRLGSYVMIGLLLVNKEIGGIPNHSTSMGCPEGCSLCMDVCPNGAINDNLTIDACRCIAYITLESPKTMNVDTHGHILGCDRCLEACPFNRDVEMIDPIINVDWTRITQEDFAASFKKSSLGRVGLDKIRSIIGVE